MSDTQIQQMVDKFLSWKLPEDLIPDGGISIRKIEGFQPVGTNLLTATQAEQMIRYITEGFKTVEKG